MLKRLDEQQAQAIHLLKKELERRFQVDDVKPKFDEKGNFEGFTYSCSEEEHEMKAKRIDLFLRGLGLINIDYIK